MLLALLACQPETVDDSAPIVDDGCVHPVWEGAWPFPNDRLLVEDDSTVTGRRLVVDPADVPPTRNDGPSLDAAWLDADGFSRIAPVVVQLDTPVDPAAFGAVADAAAPVHVLGSTGRLTVSDDGTTITVWPDAALSTGRHTIVLRSDLPTATCFSGGPAWEEARRAGDAYADEIEASLADVEAADIAADDVAAVVPFTTRSALDESKTMDWLAANTASLVGADAVDLTRAECPDGHRWCSKGMAAVYEGRITLPRWQADDGGFVTDADGVPTQQGEDRLSAWLLLPDTDTPAPLVVIQHGLGGNKDSLASVGRSLATAGYAVVSINAVEHGDRLDGDDETLAFFGIDFTQWQLPKARDNIRQTSADHLGVRTAVLAWAAEQGLAIDPVEGAYLGQSLGGIIGASTCALDTGVGRCALNVPGGRLVEIVRANAAYAALMNIYFEPGDQDADVELFSAMAQTIVDPADPAIVIRRLFDRSPARPVLIQEAIWDGTVVNQTTEVLARSAGVPLLTPSLEDIAYIPTEPAPVADNVTGEGGVATGGLTQFDAEHPFLTEGEAEGERAFTQILGFLGSGEIE